MSFCFSSKSDCLRSNPERLHFYFIDSENVLHTNFDAGKVMCK